MSRQRIQPRRAPDGITPLVGYRVWTLSVGPGRRTLRSINGQIVYEVDLNHPLGRRADGWLVARCLTNEHEAPEESCHCGFYAVKSLFTLGRLLPLATTGWAPARMADRRAATFLVAGRVDLAGKIVEHDLGYRAERVRVAELLAFCGTEQTVARFARRLGVPAGEPIPDPDDLAGATIVPGGSAHGHFAEILRKLALTRDRAPLRPDGAASVSRRT
jgi:hypothetical protein